MKLIRGVRIWATMALIMKKAAISKLRSFVTATFKADTIFVTVRKSGREHSRICFDHLILQI